MNTQNIENQTIRKNDYFSNNLTININNFITIKKSEQLAKNTIRFYQVNLGKFSEYCEAKALTTIDELTPVFIQEFLLYLSEEKGLNTGGVLVYYRSIKAFLNWYFWYYEIMDMSNPIKKVKPPKKKNQPLIEHVNFTNSQIIIPKGKGNKARFVFFTRQTRLQLTRYYKNYAKNNRYLFSNQTGEKLVYTALRQILRRRSEQANVKEVSLHDFRRHFALKSLNKGMDILSISRILGHRDTTLVATYANQNASDLEEKYKQFFEDN